MNIFRVIAFILAGVSSAASAQHAGAPDDRPDQKIAFWQLGSFDASGINQPMRMVVTRQADLDSLWKRVHANATTPPPVPTVDFSKQVVVALALGQRSTGGYAIRAQEVIDAPTAIVIAVTSHAPGANCVTTAASTAPVELISIAAPAKPVRFTEDSRIFSCGPFK